MIELLGSIIIGGCVGMFLGIIRDNGIPIGEEGTDIIRRKSMNDAEDKLKDTIFSKSDIQNWGKIK